MKASLSGGGDAFLLKEICSCAQRESSLLLPDVRVKRVHLPQGRQLPEPLMHLQMLQVEGQQ